MWLYIAVSCFCCNWKSFVVVLFLFSVFLLFFAVTNRSYFELVRVGHCLWLSVLLRICTGWPMVCAFALLNIAVNRFFLNGASYYILAKLPCTDILFSSCWGGKGRGGGGCVGGGGGLCFILVLVARKDMGRYRKDGLFLVCFCLFWVFSKVVLCHEKGSYLFHNELRTNVTWITAK